MVTQPTCTCGGNGICLVCTLEDFEAEAAGNPLVFTPAVLVIRHPDFPNEIFTDGAVRVIDADLGGSFDVTCLTERDKEAVTEWAKAIGEQISDLPTGSKVRRAAGALVDGVLTKLDEEVQRQCRVS